METTQTNPASAASAYHWRPAERSDLPAIHALLLATAAADGDPRTPSLEDLAREFDDPWFDPPVDSRLVFAPDGAVAALARVLSNPEPVEEARAYLMDEVHPAHRAALHAPVLAWLIQRGTERLQALTGYTGPKFLRLGAADHLAERIALYERHDFRPIRYFYQMRRDLSQPIPDHPLPPGLRLATFQPEYSEALRQADNEAFLDHWGHETIAPADWELFFMQSTIFRPDLTQIVFDGDEIAAFSINRVDPDENERQGYTTGWIQALGTRRPWRKRGLASALLVTSMRAFQAEGLQFATLGVDAENPTGALGLYERLGFVAFKRFIAFQRPHQA